MKNNKISERLTALRCMRITSTAIVASMLLTLTACGDSSSQQDSGMVTEENSTIERVTEIPNEPGYEIAPGADIPETSTEEPSSTEESPSDNGTTENSPTGGEYTYTVYGDIQLSMGVNIDDYVWTNDAGQNVFGIFDLALDLGWWPGTPGSIPVDPSSFGGTREGWNSQQYGYSPAMFYYPTKDGAIVLQFDGYDAELPEFDNRSQICWCSVYNTNTDCGDSVASSMDKDHLSIKFGEHYHDVSYIVPSHLNFVASRDDIVILAYILSSIHDNSGVIPFEEVDMSPYGGALDSSGLILP